MNIGRYVEMYSEDLKFKNYSSNTIENYKIYIILKFTYSTGLFNIPKQSLDLRIQTTNPYEVNTIKQREWDNAKKFVDSY